MTRLHLDFANGTSAWITLPMPKEPRWTLDIRDDGECYAVDREAGTRVHLSDDCKRDVAKAVRAIKALNRIYDKPAS